MPTSKVAATSKHLRATQRILLLIRKTLSEFNADRCPHMAAAISYYVLFSVFPLAVFVVATASFFFDREEVIQKVLDGIDQLVPVSSDREDNEIVDIIDAVVGARGALSGLALIGVAFSGSAMFGALRTALNVAWDVEQSRPLVQQKLLDLGAAAGVGALFFLSVGGTTALQIVRNATDRLGPLSEVTGVGWDLIFALLPALFSMVAFTVVYRFVPNAGVRWREALVGGAVATLLFELAKNAFAVYLRNFSNYNETYGSLGALMAFLLWVYITAAIVLLGAELASEVPRVWGGHYDRAAAEAPPPGAAKTGLRLPRRLAAALRGRFFHAPAGRGDAAGSQEDRPSSGARRKSDR